MRRLAIAATLTVLLFSLGAIAYPALYRYPGPTEIQIQGGAGQFTTSAGALTIRATGGDLTATSATGAASLVGGAGAATVRGNLGASALGNPAVVVDAVYTGGSPTGAVMDLRINGTSALEVRTDKSLGLGSATYTGACSRAGALGWHSGSSALRVCRSGTWQAAQPMTGAEPIAVANDVISLNDGTAVGDSWHWTDLGWTLAPAGLTEFSVPIITAGACAAVTATANVTEDHRIVATIETGTVESEPDVGHVLQSAKALTGSLGVTFCCHKSTNCATKTLNVAWRAHP
jgi:hypothetical protein